jgi:hypothetical protein
MMIPPLVRQPEAVPEITQANAEASLRTRVLLEIPEGDLAEVIHPKTLLALFLAAPVQQMASLDPNVNNKAKVPHTLRKTEFLWLLRHKPKLMMETLDLTLSARNATQSAIKVTVPAPVMMSWQKRHEWLNWKTQFHRSSCWTTSTNQTKSSLSPPPLSESPTVTLLEWIQKDGPKCAAERIRMLRPKVWMPPSPNLQRLTVEEYCLRYPKTKRRRLERAYAAMLGAEDPINWTEREARIKAFIKVEPCLTDPRNISPRSAIYTLMLGRYIAAFETYMHDCPWLVKGLDLREREERLSALFEIDEVTDGPYFETDFSRFDAHVSKFLLLVEHHLYIWAFPDDKLLVALLRLQLTTKGLHVCGII